MNKFESLNELSTLLADTLVLNSPVTEKASKHALEKTANTLKQEIHQHLLLLAASIQRGKNLFLKYSSSAKIEAIFKKVESNIEAINKNESKVKDMALIAEKDYQALFETAFQVYEKDKLEEASYMMSVLSLLQPLHVQPYILLGTIVWRQKGCAEACKMYNNFVQVLKDPLLYYYAADCYYHNKEKAEAKKLLTEAVDLCKKLHSPESTALLKEIKAYLKKWEK